MVILEELEGKLDPRQYGTLRGRSTTHELVDILPCNIFCDDVTIILTFIIIIIIIIITDFGVSQVLIRSVRSFLCDRQQRVKLSQYVSEWLTLKGGMPQGSYLGPLIFWL